jgi:putative ABC transport system substrate-binding protein
MQLNTVAISVFLALSMLAAPLTADTQPPVNVRRIGVLSLAPPGPTLDTLRQGLRELGWVEDENVVLEEREAQGKHERFPGLVQLRVDVIVTITTPAALAAKNATTTIPIVMAGVANPVELGLVASLARPGGNIMGLTHFPGPEFSGKGLGLLKEAVPGLTRVAVLFASRGGIQLSLKLDLDAQQAAAQALGITLIPLDVNTLDALRGAFVTTTREHADGLFVYAIGILREHEKLLVDFAGTNRLPTMFQDARSVQAGGLMSYYTNWSALPRRAASYVDRILKGTNPGDLPVERPAQFELVINLKTAKALSLTIPPSLLFQADEVIR